MWDVKFGGNYKTYSVAKGYITNDFNGKTYPQIIQDMKEMSSKVSKSKMCNASYQERSSDCFYW